MNFGLDDDLDAGEEKELDEEQINRVHCLSPGIFGRIIADEAQKFKSPATVAHRSVYDLQAPSQVLSTATPMIDRPIDLIDPAHAVLAGFIGRPRPGEALLRGLYQGQRAR